MRFNLGTKIRSYAKINLGIKVLYQYKNGYHCIYSIFVPINLHDTLHFKKSKKDLDIRIADTSSHLSPKLTQDVIDCFKPENIENNILSRTYNWFIKWVFAKQQVQWLTQPKKVVHHLNGIQIHVQKNIPSPSGLGGASSNSATFLRFLVRKVLPYSNVSECTWLTRLQKDVIELGSDIPFFLQNQPALIIGTGEIHRFIALPRMYGILGIPNFGFSTKNVYAQLNSPLQNEKRNNDRYGSRVKLLLDTVDPLAMPSGGKELIFLNIAHLTSVFSEQKIPTDLCYLQNDLFDACTLLQKEQANFIGYSMHTLAQSVSEHIKKKSPVLYSMSGSGSTFYALSSKKNSTKQIKHISTVISHQSYHASYIPFHTLGRSQAVRQRVLIPPCAGSNPAGPALISPF